MLWESAAAQRFGERVVVGWAPSTLDSVSYIMSHLSQTASNSSELCNLCVCVGRERCHASNWMT